MSPTNATNTGTNRAMNVNLPVSNMVATKDFPGGPDLALLMEMRERVRKIGESMGLSEVGCGVGVGGADVQVQLDGQYLFVRINIEDAP